MNRPYLIAEIGVNYYDTAKELGITPLDAAKLYIQKAVEAGVSCVKFQTYKAEKIASVNSPAYWDQSKESSTSQYELFKKFDKFGEEEYKTLSDYAHSLGTDFTSTPFDEEAVDFLDPLVDFFKISSSDITNIQLLKKVGAKGKNVMISAGASELEEIRYAVNLLKNCGAKNISIFHCMLSYPTKPEDANLLQIITLKKEFPEYRIGYSDHVPPDESMLTLCSAFALGAQVIEKHFTLNKKLTGNDHYHAGDPEDFALAVKNFEYISKLLGTETIQVLECELESRKQARRSLVFARDLESGHILSEKDFIAKRPGTGISPVRIEEFIGKELKKSVKADELLQEEFINSIN